MKILVLGGTGAMGVDLIKILAGGANKLAVTSRSPRDSEYGNVRYIRGDAHNSEFLKELLRERYDAVVDFMVYTTEEFASKRDMFLDSTSQYIFLSSSRVYADSNIPIREDFPRLLDALNDEHYFRTDEYALAKARQEDQLRKSGKENWTIVRPYITYSSQRLQLGVYEKELWLYRALYGRTIFFQKPIGEKYTTMTLGEDAANCISKLICNERALGKAFHIAANKAIRWNEALDVYKRVFEEVTGREMRVEYVSDPEPIYNVMGNKYQVIYDRLFDRRFDGGKLTETAGKCDFTAPAEGLARCLREFLMKPEFRKLPLKIHAWMDRKAGENTKPSEFKDMKSMAKYAVYRYTPALKILNVRK